MPFNGAGADEQFRADLRIGAAVSGQPGDVFFLWSELDSSVDLPFTHLLAGGEQLSPGSFGECVGPHHCKQLVGGVQLVTCVDSAVLASEPLAVEEVGAGEVGLERC